MKPDQDDRAQDDELERTVRAHFAQARTPFEVPGFETVLARAEAVDAVSRTGEPSGWLVSLIDSWSSAARWAGTGAVAAALVLAVAMIVTLQSEDPHPDEKTVLVADQEEQRKAVEQQLLASLESTTRWQAPSDRWPSVETDIDLFGLPDIGGAEVLKEESTWL